MCIVGSAPSSPSPCEDPRWATGPLRPPGEQCCQSVLRPPSGGRAVCGSTSGTSGVTAHTLREGVGHCGHGSPRSICCFGVVSSVGRRRGSRTTSRTAMCCVRAELCCTGGRPRWRRPCPVALLLRHLRRLQWDLGRPPKIADAPLAN